MAFVVVEKTYEEPFSDADWDEADRILGPCMEVRSIRWIRSLVSQDRKRTVCLFEAPDAESVREAHRSAGLTFERIYAAREVTPDP